MGYSVYLDLTFTLVLFFLEIASLLITILYLFFLLPSVTLSLFQMTYIIRLVRAEMMEILQTDYIKFARARGISEKSIHYKHALKNGLIPVITIAGINIGTLIAFSIITETVFQWPGMGFLFIII